MNDKHKKSSEKIKERKHMGKPNTDDAMVFYDTNGQWIFEIYTGKNKIK